MRECSSILLAARLPELQVVVFYRRIPQVKTALVGNIAGIPGEIVPLAIYQDTIPAAPGRHQQAAGHTLVITGKVLVGDQKGHIPQQIGGKMLKLLAGQLKDLDDLDLDGLLRLVLHQFLDVIGFEKETAVDYRFRQTFHPPKGVVCDTLILMDMAGQGASCDTLPLHSVCILI